MHLILYSVLCRTARVCNGFSGQSHLQAVSICGRWRVHWVSVLDSGHVWSCHGDAGVCDFIPQPVRAVGVLFSLMVSGWAGGCFGGGKKFLRAVSQKL